MNTVQKSLRLPNETAHEIEKMAQEKPEDFAKLLRSWIAKD